jgi:hypothetical protein
MSCCAEWDLNHINDYNSVDFITELQENVKAFLDYSLLNIGGWTDVNTGENNCGEDYFSLVKVKLPVSRPYEIWASPKKEWLWEDVEFYGDQPNIPTIYDTGINITSDCTINYKLGQISSNTPLTSPTASYSFRKVQIYTEIFGSWWLKVTEKLFDNSKSDIYTLLRQHSVQLPAIVIEVSNTSSKPMQIGSSALIIEQDLVFNIIAGDPKTRNKLASFLVQQDGKNFHLFNTDPITPIDCGAINTGIYWNELPNWRCSKITFKGSNSFNIGNPDLFFNRTKLGFRIFNPTKPKL